MYSTLLLLVSALVFSYSIVVDSAPVQVESGRQPSPQCDPDQENDCSTCYDLLANELIVSDKNRFNLQQAFFPPNNSNPVFVTVSYYFTRNPNGSTNYSADSPKKIWFWTESTFYLFQPVSSLQFTSLLFSDTTLKTSEVYLYLQPSCNGSSTDMMRLLTQRVSFHHAHLLLASIPGRSQLRKHGLVYTACACVICPKNLGDRDIL